MAVSREDIRAAFERQSRYCRGRDAQLTAAMIDAASLDLQCDGPVAALLDGFNEDPGKSGLALRIAGAVHYLVSMGRAEALEAVFRDLKAPAPDTIAPRLAALVESEPAVFQSFASRPPQTNEVNRLATLLPALSEVANACDLPLDLYELGSSGGLLLAPDRTTIDYGAFQWGDGPIGLRSEWRGDRPPLADRLNVRNRRGCDRNPIDFSDPEQLDIARSYFWPEHPARRARFESAIVATRDLDIKIDRADALDWLVALDLPKAGAVSVIFTSVFAVYLNDEETLEMNRLISAFGEKASDAAPVAFVQFEPEEVLDFLRFNVDVTVWPGGARRRIATSHAHGAWVEPIAD